VAPDAVFIDTTDMDVQAVVERALTVVNEAIGQ
jgi:cytidylate kinase